MDYDTSGGLCVLTVNASLHDEYLQQTAVSDARLFHLFPHKTEIIRSDHVQKKLV